MTEGSGSVYPVVAERAIVGGGPKAAVSVLRPRRQRFGTNGTHHRHLVGVSGFAGRAGVSGMLTVKVAPLPLPGLSALT